MTFSKSINLVYGLLSSRLLIKASANRSSSSSSRSLSVINPTNPTLFWAAHSLQSLSSSRSRMQWNMGQTKRSFIACSVVPGAPPPSQPPPSNIMNWILGVVVTVVLPFVTHKWVAFLKLKNEVDTAVQKAEDIAEVIEKVADEVEKVAEDIADDLPKGGRLRKAVEFVEDAAERTSKDAHLVGDFIDKVQEAEEKVEKYVEAAEELHTQEKERPQA